MQRRELFKYVTAGLAVANAPSMLLASNQELVGKKIIWVLLRGGLDSIDTIMPTFENAVPQTVPGGIPMGIVIIGMAVLGIFGILISFLRGN